MIAPNKINIIIVSLTTCFFLLSNYANCADNKIQPSKRIKPTNISGRDIIAPELADDNTSSAIISEDISLNKITSGTEINPIVTKQSPVDSNSTIGISTSTPAPTNDRPSITFAIIMIIGALLLAMLGVVIILIAKK